MARNTSVEIGNELDSFIQTQVEVGRYSSASEVVRAGLRLLQDEETKLKVLKAALIEGEKSDLVEGFDMKKFIAEQRLHTNG